MTIYESQGVIPRHVIHEETGAGLTDDPDLHFMGKGLFAQYNAGSTRLEVIAGAYYDAIVDNADTNAAGKGNVYSTIALAIAAGHESIFVKSAGDVADITIASSDAVLRILGDATLNAAIPVNITSDKLGLSFEFLSFNGKWLKLTNDRQLVLGCFFTGALTPNTGTLNNASGITSTGLSIAWNTDGGASGNLPAGPSYCRIDNEFIAYTSGGGVSSGTLVVNNASRRGLFEGGGVRHDDNSTITDITGGHVIVEADDITLLTCQFIACTNANSSCVSIRASSARTRITSCQFINNSTLADVVTMAADTSSYRGCQISACVFSSISSSGSVGGISTGTQRVLAFVAAFPSAGATTGMGDARGVSINGSLFREYDGLAIRQHGGYWNITGNTFDQTAEQSLFAVVNAPSSAGSTNTTYTATTMTDSTPQVWIRDEWVGHTITAGASTGTITANEGSSVTVGSWSAGTPANGTGYSINSGMTATQTAVRIDGFSGAGTMAVRGLVQIENELISYVRGGSGHLTDLGRGMNGTTAAAHADNTTPVNFVGQIGIMPTAIGNGGVNTHIVVGGMLCSTNRNHIFSLEFDWRVDGSGKVPALTLSTSVMPSGTITLSQNSTLIGLSIPSTTIDFRSRTGSSITGYRGNTSTVFSNLASDTGIFGGPSASVSSASLATPNFFPNGKFLGLGRLSTDVAQIGITVINATGAAGVPGNIVIYDVTTNNQVVNPPVAAGSTLVAGVVLNAAANAADMYIADKGTVTVNCDTAAIAVGGYLGTSAITAGLATNVAAPAFNTYFARALSAKAAGANGTVRARLVLQ